MPDSQNKEFFLSLLPDEGWFCGARLLPSGGWMHRFFQDRETLYSHLLSLDAKGETMYFAQASFKTDANRKQENAAQLKCFFLDIDCGPTKPYATQEEALKDIGRFLEKTELPAPSIVNSGNGLYAYWRLIEPLEEPQWKELARILKDICTKGELKVDAGLTANSSAVLRPVGTHNRKNTDNVKDVLIQERTPPLTAQEFISALERAAKKTKANAAALKPPKEVEGLSTEELFNNAEFRGHSEHRDSYAELIAERCELVSKFREVKGNVPEPYWYAVLGLLSYCVDGHVYIHDWSYGHPDYNYDTTEKKALQWKEKCTGPPNCTKLAADAGSNCVACPYKGKINSLIGLGYKQAAEVSAEQIGKAGIPVPSKYGRSEKGIVHLTGDIETVIYPYDVDPVAVGHDYTLGHEVFAFRIQDPYDGWRKITIRAALFNDPKACLMNLADQGMTMQGNTEKGLMVGFLEGYMNSLKAMEKRSKFCAQMGWQPDPNGDLIFVLGDTIYHRDGSEKIGLAGSISEVAKNFRGQGSLEVWSELTKAFDTPSIEPLAFEFLSLAFGAPLMYFTGYSGAMISAKGAESGVGKTVSAEWGLSAYGPPKKLELHQNDTQNALVSRLGVCNTLPIYIDEITEMRPEDLSNLVYRLTDGRDKLSLTAKRTEREGQTWCTLAVVTANNGVVDKLGGFKPDASAQINRVFEYTVASNPHLTVEFWKKVVPVFMENYGHAGAKYVEWLVKHQDEHKDQIQKFISIIQERIGAYPEERFWVAVLATTLYGAVIAQQLGLIRFDISKVFTWGIQHVSHMRVDKAENTCDAVTVLATYLDLNLEHILVLGDTKNKIPTIIREPKYGLLGRFEYDKQRLFISTSAMKECFKKYGFSRAKSELSEMFHPPLIKFGAGERKVLGAGTKYGLGSPQHAVWVIDTSVDSLGCWSREVGEK